MLLKMWHACNSHDKIDKRYKFKTEIDRYGFGSITWNGDRIEHKVELYTAPLII